MVGRWVAWLVLATVLISAGNAVVRKVFNTSSNALLEIQWYLFAAIFLLAAGYTLLRQEHVKIDVVLGPLLAAHPDQGRDLWARSLLMPSLWPSPSPGLALVVRAYVTGEQSAMRAADPVVGVRAAARRFGAAGVAGRRS